MTIDWEQIWRDFSPFYKDGRFVVPIKNHKDVLLSSGPSFGDGSHDTTNLVLSTLGSNVKDKVLVDVGAGSGILSLVAAAFGAKKIYSLEIDPPSILHLKKNIALNNFKNIVVNEKPEESIDVVLINMISSEQKIALQNNPFLIRKNVTYVISGILEEEMEDIAQNLYFAEMIDSKVINGWGLVIARS